MEQTHENIVAFIAGIRDSFDGSVKVYTEGSCYQFYRILKSVFPAAEAYYDYDHVITRIGDRYYDITGEVERTKNHDPYSECHEATVHLNKYYL